MTKHRIFIPILIVIVIIILIVSYSILFGKRKGMEDGGKQPGNGAEVTVTRIPITPAIEAEYSGDLIDELNESPKAEYKYILSSGEEITIKIPRGVDPPPLAVVERMYQKRRE
ncbi:hypothetical protein A2W14_01405 [Candidatus Gottesmanbacteria bacterium RBG_16_37_8]|uniref:Uncharacterized protein n=1 Tax=Candidatus Gottesmanbacteria bacterium RBG_16_37_8 TaxID=1798371 RepID=A0A1F5YUW8_9BACT|nr:MAG: hypothetical protein A2W14_01405 [Candidatus Gottesmanbacteria bacterium RBG_16_37_8]